MAGAPYAPGILAYMPAHERDSATGDVVLRSPGAVMAAAQHPMQGGLAPTWAVGWGEDRHGVFAAFAVGPTDKKVEHRMRWIPPGTFVMGSPETELGRFEDEGPQHEVTLTRGYWLGETPVTQALWTTVMGENPSHFRRDELEVLERPVEQVSWDECKAFLARVNALVPGIAARLPTEAEWERACRAGTSAATWVGELSDKDEAPVLDAIAWYGRNSGRETQPVGRKAPNPYGLRDMLGNVWEWCDDDMRSYAAEPVVDPVHAGLGSRRVARGGSWRYAARNVRAAYRYGSHRGVRDGNVGCRLAGG